MTRGCAPWTPGFPFRLLRLRGRQVGRKWRPCVSQRRNPRSTWRQPLHLLHETGGTETNTGSNDKRLKENEQRPRCHDVSRAGSGRKKEGRRKGCNCHGQAVRAATPRLILRSDAKHCVSKDGPVGAVGRAGWSVLRDATPGSRPGARGSSGRGEAWSYKGRVVLGSA